MSSSHLLGVLLALTSAAVWGGGDFSGGAASRRTSAIQVLALSAVAGLLLLILLAAARGEAWPPMRSLAWAAGGGAAGALGVAALYRALAMGEAAHVAPTAAVVSVALPVVVSMLTEGWPGAWHLAGFALAGAGIWLASASARGRSPVARAVLGLALLAGLGFGSFFVLIARVEPGSVFVPLVVARAATLAVALLLLALRRLPMPAPLSNPIALLAGVLDAGGNIFYLLSKQFTRLDIAAVLASLYPVSTVLLAHFMLKQTITRAQWAGVGLCMAAVVLITL